MPSLPQESFFSELLRVSEKEKLSFLVVGGNAINAYGYQRTTFDIDIAVPEDQANAWQSQLALLGYESYFSTPAFLRLKAKDGSLLFPVDLMILGQATFKKLSDGGSQKAMGTVNVPVPSAVHLIAMKLHALRQPLRAAQGKDLMDVIGLVRAAKIDVQSDEFKDILQKHADPATREKILGILDQGL